VAYNIAHGITPKGVSKRIKDMIEGVYDPSTLQDLKAAEKLAAYGAMNEKDLLRELKRVEKAMLDAARNLEFEAAAQLRDQLKELKELAFGITERNQAPAAATGTDGRLAKVASIAVARKRSR
jgi:excinuclease ABC subunit B